MSAPLVVLTGASGSGKTSIAEAIEKAHPELTVFRSDTIGVPSAEVMASYGNEHQPGGAWQRAMTMQWLERIVPILRRGRPVLFEGQMLIAFIKEALAFHEVPRAKIVLVDCDDATRTIRLIHDRRQPELANESMMGWARYLLEEAAASGCEIHDTSSESLANSVARVACYFV